MMIAKPLQLQPVSNRSANKKNFYELLAVDHGPPRQTEIGPMTRLVPARWWLAFGW